MGALATTDWIVIGAYFMVIIGLAWWVIRQKTDTTSDYFLAGRNLGWIIVGASIFSSNIGSEHLVGLAGSGATSGVALAPFELQAWCLLILAWVMLPFYIRSKVFTMPEFLERRFSPAARTILSGISLIAYVLTKIAVGIFAGGIVFGVLMPNVHFLGLNSFWVGSILVIAVTGLYTILGGLRAVAYTEALQTVVLVIGSILVLIYGLKAIGGWDRLYHFAGSGMFDLWKPVIPKGMTGTWAPVIKPGKIAWYFNKHVPWPAMLFGAPIVGLWYWTTDQYIVQRALGAPNEKQGRRGSIAAGFLKLLPVFIFMIPGIIAFALAKSGAPVFQHQMLNAQGQVINEKAQAAFPLLVVNILPVGVRGIVVAGLLAALMSSLAGVFNACSTLFTIDFYKRFRPNVSEQHLVWIGRVATGVMIFIALLWIPVIKGSRGLYAYLQGVQSYIAPPIFVVFFFGIFSKRLNKQGCLAAMGTGFFLGLFRLAVDTPVTLQGVSYTKGSFFWIINNIYFQYYSLGIFIICVIVMFTVSYATAAPQYEKIAGLTYGTLSADDRRASRSTWNWIDIALSVLVIVAVVISYLIFTG